MNLTCAKFGNKRLPKGAALICLFLLTAVPALADPVSVHQVVQTLSNSQSTIDLRLKTLVAQDPAKGGTQQNGPRADGTQTQGGPKNEPVVSGVAITSEGQQLGIEYIEEGEVDGTICDCGEILIAGGAFPKWPFLFLGAVPLVFIHDCNSCDEVDQPVPTPTPPSISSPTPTPPGVPEPASLFLFGTGLAAAGAGLRRRLAKTRTQEEE
jgi:PEP-CTERM motif